MATEQLTETQRLALQIISEFKQKGEYSKAYTSGQVLGLISNATRDLAPKAAVNLNLDIAAPRATVRGDITLPDPDVTISVKSLVYENDPSSKAARLKLAEPVQWSDTVREKNPAKLVLYQALKGIVVGTLNDPQTLLAKGFQKLLDENQAGMKVTAIAAKIQQNGAIGIKIVGTPK